MSLTYGSLVLTSSPYLIEFGMDTGAPQNVTEALAFLLQDGEVELSSRASNRTLQFNVLIEGANLLALATAEAALVAETEKALNTITIDPGDSGPATVYETYRAQVTLVRDDDWEQSRMRRYTVTVRAIPFPKSNAEVTVAALAASGTTTTLVDAGSATTGWTGAVNGGASAPSVVSGAVGVTSTALPGSVTVALTRTGSITTSSTKYLMIDWRGAANYKLRAFGDGTELTQAAQFNSPTSGYIRTWFNVPASSIAVLLLQQTSNWQYGTATRSLFIDNINRTDVRPSLGSARQLQRTVELSGSARAPGRVAIEHATSALGYTIAYFWPDGYPSSPPLRQYRVSGGSVTTDATKISGAYEPIKSTTITYGIPISQLNAGSHLLMAKMFSASSIGGSTTTVTYTHYTSLGGVPVSDTVTGTVTVPNTTLSGASYTVLGRLLLPTLDVDPNSGAIQFITLNATTTLADLSLDEAWLFNTSIGQLSVVWSAGTSAPSVGGAANRIYIEPASVSTPRPTISIGTNADRSDARMPKDVASFQVPVFEPPRVNVFTVTPNALDAAVSLTYYPHWHTSAAL